MYLTDSLLWRLAKRLSHNYRDLGISLGIPRYVIDEIEVDYRGSVAKIADKVLETWKNADKRQDTYEMYNELLVALSSIKRNDLVDFFKAGE